VSDFCFCRANQLTNEQTSVFAGTKIENEALSNQRAVCVFVWVSSLFDHRTCATQQRFASSSPLLI